LMVFGEIEGVSSFRLDVWMPFCEDMATIVEVLKGRGQRENCW
jgi:hypothetical protein